MDYWFPEAKEGWALERSVALKDQHGGASH